jgi:hypothetical protein
VKSFGALVNEHGTRLLCAIVVKVFVVGLSILEITPFECVGTFFALRMPLGTQKQWNVAHHL